MMTNSRVTLGAWTNGKLTAPFYDEQDHRRISNFGKGRPIVHILTILDERTTYIIDHLVTWQISLEEAVFALAERTIRQHFLPKRFVSDRAGRFRALVRGTWCWAAMVS